MTLDSRKGRILQAIVSDYVQTAEPIGSEWLVTHYDFGCKSATLRNEMAEMSDLGYLVQPHTSAGRIPSNRGYRYYVDRLMTPEPLTLHAKPPIKEADAARMEAEEIVQATCRALADLAQYPSVASTPIVNSGRLHRLYLAPATDRHALLVMLFSTGHVAHALLEIGSGVGEPALQRVTNYMNASFGGCDVDEIAASRLEAVPVEMGPQLVLLRRAHQSLAATARNLTEKRLVLEGTAYILRQREFQDVLRLEQLLSALEQRSALFQVFTRAVLGADVSVTIGSETEVESMSEYSVVTSSYRIGGRTGGFIGVVGPTRMNYDRAVSAVGLMARSLSSMLSRASLE